MRGNLNNMERYKSKFEETEKLSIDELKELVGNNKAGWSSFDIPNAMSGQIKYKEPAKVEFLGHAISIGNKPDQIFIDVKNIKETKYDRNMARVIFHLKDGYVTVSLIVK